MTPTKKTVQIIAGVPSTTVPFLPEGHERWGLNNIHFAKRCAKFDNWTRWFDLHHKDHIILNRPGAYGWYTVQEKPIVMWAPDPLIPSSVAYPRVELQQFFSVNGSPERYFLSSIDWMLALAIFEGFQHIDIFSVRMSSNEKYFFQLASAMYWVSRARALGITVLVHGESNLNPSNKLYGFESTAAIDMQPYNFQG